MLFMISSEKKSVFPTRLSIVRLFSNHEVCMFIVFLHTDVCGKMNFVIGKWEIFTRNEKTLKLVSFRKPAA